MERLNYHHLLYFRTVVREGGVSRAAARLRLAQPTVTGQLRALEHVLGERLFERRGRGLQLTEVGRLVHRYADEIFSLGEELQEMLRGGSGTRPLRLAVGVADAMPKLVAHRLLEPALRGPTPVRLEVREDGHERLLAALALHELDVILTDAPLAAGSRVRAFQHLLAETGVDVFAAPRLAGRLRRGWPGSLDGMPFLLPSHHATMRRALETWFEQLGVRPRILGEFDDSALIREFGEQGVGAFAAPAAIAARIEAQHRVRRVGAAGRLREHYYAITVERRLRHPAVAAITASARREWTSSTRRRA